jgi:hypothetical protein
MLTYLPDAKSSDVIGQRIIGVEQKLIRGDTGISHAWNFYSLSSGLILTLGFDDGDDTSVYDSAEPLDIADWAHVLNETIESAWQLPDDLDFSPYALRMEGGLFIMELLFAVEGTGLPGVCLFPETDIPCELTRLW